MALAIGQQRSSLNDAVEFANVVQHAFIVGLVVAGLRRLFSFDFGGDSFGEGIETLAHIAADFRDVVWHGWASGIVL
jgi:hypothetical protein